MRLLPLLLCGLLASNAAFAASPRLRILPVGFDVTVDVDGTPGTLTVLVKDSAEFVFRVQPISFGWVEMPARLLPDFRKALDQTPNLCQTRAPDSAPLTLVKEAGAYGLDRATTEMVLTGGGNRCKLTLNVRPYLSTRSAVVTIDANGQRLLNDALRRVPANMRYLREYGAGTRK